MATLRSNLLLSTAAMVLVGAIRPAFNAIVNRVFGPEVNAQANAQIAMFFIAALPATAALPAVMVRHVSRALGRDDDREAAGFARLAMGSGLLLAILGAIGVLLWDRFSSDLLLTQRDLVFVVVGVVGYSLWRIQRTLLVALGHASTSLVAEIVGVVTMFGALIAAVYFDAPSTLVGAVVLMYVTYTLLVVPIVERYTRRATIGADARRSFYRFNALWFVGAASSLATREVALLLLVDRVDPAIAGDVSVAMSLIMLLAFAPRIIEVPLVHELARLGSGDNAQRQIQLAEKATHWLMIFTFAAGCGASIVAGPVLALVGGVKAPVAAIAFAVIASAFMIEMMVTPLTNLLVAEAPPSVLTWFGLVSLIAAIAWWTLGPSTGAIGIVSGLAISYLVKGVGVAWYARTRLGVRVLEAPFKKAGALAAGAALTFGALDGRLNPFLALAAFTLLIAGLFVREIFDVKRAVLGA